MANLNILGKEFANVSGFKIPDINENLITYIDVASMPTPLSSYHVTLGDGVETTFSVSHYLNTQFILVSAVVTDNGTTYIASNSSGSDSSRISYIVNIINDNSFSITFSSPPAANSIKLSVISAIVQVTRTS